MGDLPVREMVLYKHGVGFFRREGETNAEEVTLTFRHDEINDVLKSLAVFDRKGGHVLGIHYQTPLDRDARLADSSIRLSDHASAQDLLRDLRGREVELIFSDDRVRGRLIGLDIGEEDNTERTLISVMSDPDGQVHVFRLRSLRAVRILDGRAAHDLRFFLDTSMHEELRRKVTVRLSQGDHKLVIYYVAPCPTWRVSYRLVAESDERGVGGGAALQGWGLFDNRLDEDLVDVAVTLVAGQPISFIYDLYASYIPPRPTVRDEARIAPGPVEFREARGRRASIGMEAYLAQQEPSRLEADRTDMLAMAAPMPGEHSGLRREDLQAAVQPAAEAHEAGEFFQYVVATPVSVRRGESALVPIISADVSYSKELLYNGTKLPDHPVAAMRFANTTGLTLERGPVTVIEDGEYKGEAVVSFTKPGSEVYLPYAVELGLQITERTQQHSEMAGLNVREGYLLISEYHISTVTYIVENTTDKDMSITIEAPVRPGFELFDTPEPEATTATERRWHVPAPTRSTIEFERHERRMMRRHEEVRKLTYRSLQGYLAERWLDQTTYDRLSGLLDNLEFIERAHAEQKELRTERGEIYARQVQLRENLNALKPAGEEGPLRSRVLRQLETSEDRLEAIDDRLSELGEQIAQAETQIEQVLAELGSDTED